MAIYNGRILMRKGKEAEFDADKLMAGEWAVSLDAGIVRICLEAGKVIRMATYEAFEEDMKQIEAILLECETIEEAVQRINTEINTKVEAVVEYVGQAKTYRDEAKTFRDEAEGFKNQAGEIAGIGIATTEKAGIVKPDGTSIEVNEDGTISAKIEENIPENILKRSDVVDNFESDATNLPISANRGKELKKDVDSINEKLDILKGILLAGQNEMVIENDKITKDSVLTFYTSVYGVHPTDVLVENGSITLAFIVMDIDMEVGVRVDG